MNILKPLTILVLASSSAMAQDSCSVALSSNAFNVSDKSESLKIAFEAKESLCEKNMLLLRSSEVLQNPVDLT